MAGGRGAGTLITAPAYFPRELYQSATRHHDRKGSQNQEQEAPPLQSAGALAYLASPRCPFLMQTCLHQK